jgi:DNA repair protein RadC
LPRVSVPTKRQQLVLKSTFAAAEYLKNRLRGITEEQFRVLYLNRRNALIEDTLNLPQFDGHFKMYTLEVKGVSNEKKKPIHTRV